MDFIALLSSQHCVLHLVFVFLCCSLRRFDFWVKAQMEQRDSAPLFYSLLLVCAKDSEQL